MILFVIGLIIILLNKRPFIFLSFLLGTGIYLSSALALEPKGAIRVLVFRDAPRLEITGSFLALKDPRSGRTLFQNKKRSSFTLERSGARVRVWSHPVASTSLVVSSRKGQLAIAGRHYRGRVKVVPGQNGDLWAINELPLEEYLVGLINSEISSEWPMEALKAQAVIARTYALFQKRSRKGRPFDVDSTVADQVYNGIDREDARSLTAVRATKGEVLLYRGAPIFSVYHSCCGGKTESGENIWAGSYPYLRSTVCESCLDSPHYSWEYRLDQEKLAQMFSNPGLKGGPLEFEIAERNESQRVLRLSIKNEENWIVISGRDFRRIRGYDLLRSTNFLVGEKDGVLVFSGLGWGHGAGLCQWGAKGMAEQGRDYRTILHHYYQDTKIGKIH